MKERDSIKLSIETIIIAIMLPWAAYITIKLFEVKEVAAVQESKYDTIIKGIDEIKLRLDKKGF